MRHYFFHFFYLLLLTYLFSSSYAFASGTIQPSDMDYYIHENPSFSIIFSETFLKEKKKDFIHIYNKISYYDDIYKEIYPKELKERPIYVFTSSKNQISNAITSSIPFLRVLFFPTGVEKMTYLTATSWEDTVIAHEMAHIFQLGQISNSLKYIKPLFKNSEVIFLPFPIFLNVNLALPLFLLEGHAVLNESLFAPGGRLYSGSTRALVFSQIKNRFQTTDQFIRNYLINLTEDTFTAEQQYAHGGYFFNSLLQKYNIKTINNIFKEHAEYFIFPFSFFSLKETFQSVFDNSFESLVNLYIQTYLPIAMKQSKSSEKPLFHSHICPPFNKKNNKIFFLNSDLRSTPVLRTLNLSTGKWKKRKKVFANGKVFKINNQYYVSASSKINTTERAYGLFSEGMYLFKKYKSQAVQDIYENQTLSIDTSNNMHGFKLKLNGQFYDIVNSPALFSPKGEIHYFKQKKDQRIMYRNKNPLFQFKGFYGKPIEVDLDGTVYFIAATQFGSSLFGWNPNEGIYRVSPSDTVIDAIKSSDNQFLICEIEPEYYNYKLIHSIHIPEQPFFYKYPFKQILNSLSTLSTLSHIKLEHSKNVIKESQGTSDKAYIKNLHEIDTTTGVDELNASTALSNESTTDQPLHSTSSHTLSPTETPNDIPYSNYNSLRHIRFNGVELGAFHDPITGYNGLLNIGFRDPLEYNAFHFTYQYSTENWTLQSKYINQIYRLSWDIQHIYKQGLENFSGSRSYSYIHEFSQGFLFPLLKSGYWLLALRWKNAVSSVELKQFSTASYYFSTEPSLQIQYKRAYSKNFDFHRKFFLQTALQYNFKFSKKDSNFRLKTQSYYTMNWGSEFYTMPFFTYQTALKQKSVPFRYFKPLNLFNSSEFNFFLRERIFEETNDYLLTGIKFQKFIETPIYFARYPLSLRGLAPLLNGKYVRFLDNSNSDHFHFFEWTFGVKIAVLAHHKLKLKINLYYGYSHPLDFQLSKKKNIKEKQKIIRPKEQKSTTSNVKNNVHFGIQLQSQF